MAKNKIAKNKIEEEIEVIEIAEEIEEEEKEVEIETEEEETEEEETEEEIEEEIEEEEKEVEIETEEEEIEEEEKEVEIETEEEETEEEETEEEETEEEETEEKETEEEETEEEIEKEKTESVSALTENIKVEDYVKESNNRFNIEPETTQEEKKIEQNKRLNRQEEKIEEKNHKKKKRRKLIRSILLIIVIVLIIFLSWLGYRKYQQHLAKLEANDFPVIEQKVGMQEEVQQSILTNANASNDSINEVIGYIEIPAVQMKAPILQAKSNIDQEESLALGIAHDPLTGLPGENNSTVLAGHREEDFAALENVQIGDLVIVGIGENIFLYEVNYVGHVNEDQAGIDRVFKENTTDTLTLYTCFPFKKLSPIDGRWIVEANRIKEYNEPIESRVLEEEIE